MNIKYIFSQRLNYGCLSFLFLNFYTLLRELNKHACVVLKYFIFIKSKLYLIDHYHSLLRICYLHIKSSNIFTFVCFSCMFANSTVTTLLFLITCWTLIVFYTLGINMDIINGFSYCFNDILWSWNLWKQYNGQ